MVALRLEPALQTRSPANSAGFSLIELLITVAILATLAGGAFAFTELAATRTHEQELHTALRQIREAIDAYKLAYDTKRIKTAIDESGYPKSLDELADGVVDVSDPKGRKIFFMRRLPRDPFADNNLPAAETWGLRSYESGPDEPQAGKDIYDVYSLSPRTGLNGIAYRQW